MRHYPTRDQLAVLAHQAGSMMKSGFGFGTRRVTWKADNTPLTEADTQINEAVIGFFEQKFPHIHLLAEEGDRPVAGAEYWAVCDPIDGTSPYALGVPVSTFCLAVLKENTPLVAVLYNPFLGGAAGEMWVAERGEGCFLSNTTPVRVSDLATLKNATISAAWTNHSSLNHYLLRMFPRLDEAGGSWSNYRGGAYAGGQIASGRIHGSVFPTRKPFETPTMQLIVEEAGGKATDIFGDPLVYGPGGMINGHVISNGLLHDQILKLLHG